MRALYFLIDSLLNLYQWLVIASVILSWLIAFGILNSRSQVVYIVGNFLYRITEPALRPIRRLVHRFLPDLGGIDISPILLLLLIFFIRQLLFDNWPR